MKMLAVSVFVILVFALSWGVLTGEDTGLIPGQQDVGHKARVQLPPPAVPEIAINEPEEQWLVPELLDVFDHFLTFYEISEQQMWQEFEQYCTPLSACVEIRDLFQRYLNYKGALLALNDRQIDSALDLSWRLEQQQQTLLRFFSQGEVNTLFADYIQWEQQAIARLRINRDPTLTPEQKALSLQQHIAQLPPEQRQAIQPTMSLRKVTEINQQGEDNYNQYAAEFGPEAAQRLTQVRDETLLWQQRIRQYLLADKALQDDYQDSQALDIARQELFDGSFSANEQKRAEVYLSHPELLNSP